MEEWNNKEDAVYESAVLKTASRMKRDGMTNAQISLYTGLREDEIEDL